jgi:hypothetical protein
MLMETTMKQPITFILINFGKRLHLQRPIVISIPNILTKM